MGASKHPNIKVAKSMMCVGAFADTYQQAIKYAKQLGYPVVVSSSLAVSNDIDGMSFVADCERELHRMLQGAFDASPINQVLIKRPRRAVGRKRTWRFNDGKRKVE